MHIGYARRGEEGREKRREGRGRERGREREGGKGGERGEREEGGRERGGVKRREGKEKRGEEVRENVHTHVVSIVCLGTWSYGCPRPSHQRHRRATRLQQGVTLQ